MDHFCEPKTVDSVEYQPMFSRSAVAEEFLLFKRLAHAERFNDDKTFRTPIELFEHLFRSTTRRLMFKNTYKLMAACCCILVCNAECERCFSCCNRIKTKLRSRMNVKTLDKLVRVAYSNHDLSSFDFEAAAKHWMSVPRRILKNT